jgi:hypothetical protein
LICKLFNNVISTAEVEIDYRRILKVLKEHVPAYFEVLSWHSPRIRKETKKSRFEKDISPEQTWVVTTALSCFMVLAEFYMSSGAFDSVLECCMPSLLLTAYPVPVAIIIYSRK